MSSPFRYGQKVCYKKSKRYGHIRSYGPAKLGTDGLCGIPDGPITFEDMVLVEIQIKGKIYICLEYVDELIAC